jgi:hypothetical protein
MRQYWRTPAALISSIRGAKRPIPNLGGKTEMNKEVARTPPPTPKLELTKAPVQTNPIKTKMSERLGDETGPNR